MFYLLLTIFFISGLTSLIYQAIWTRMLNTIFGLFIYSAVSITTTFMLGMFIGYILYPYLHKHLKDKKMLMYGFIQLAIAIYASLSPLILDLIKHIYIGLHTNSILLKLLLSIIFFLLPTTLMGITLPLISTVVDEVFLKDVGRNIGTLYGINSLGASIGIMVPVVLFFPFFTTIQSIFYTVPLNLINALLSFITYNNVKTRYTDIQKGEEKLSYTKEITTLLVFSALIGFVGMGLEIIWIRLLVYLISNNTFSFSTIISQVILGISLGSLLYSWLKEKKVDTALVSIIFVLFLLPYVSVFVIWYINVGAGVIKGVVEFLKVLGLGDVVAVWVSRWLSVLPVTVVPAISSGFLLPLIIDLIDGYRKGINRDKTISQVFAINTLGSVFAPIFTTFLLLPTIGISNSILLLVFISTLIVLPLTLFTKKYNFLVVSIALWVLLFFCFIIPRDLRITKMYDPFRNVSGNLLYYKEGIYGNVAVFDLNGEKHLKISGIEEVPTDYSSLKTFELLARIPFELFEKLVNTKPKDILINAIGGGITLGNMIEISKGEVYKPIVGIDICPDVTNAMPLFKEENKDVIKYMGSKWKFIAEDGRNYLLINEAKYDIITSDATHPSSAESWVLYTREFYKIVWERLKEKGIFAQWLPLHEIHPSDILSILKTFHSVFLNSFLFYVDTSHCIMVGIKGFEEKEVYEGLKKLESDIKRRLILTPLIFNEIQEKYKDIEISSDLKTPIEYAEIKRLGMNTIPLNINLLLSLFNTNEVMKYTGMDINTIETRLLLIEAYREFLRYSYFEALKKSWEAYKRNPQDPETEKDLIIYQATLERALTEQYPYLVSHYGYEKILEILDFLIRQPKTLNPNIYLLAINTAIALNKITTAKDYYSTMKKLFPKDLIPPQLEQILGK